jgi:hypothetical protein
MAPWSGRSPAHRNIVSTFLALHRNIAEYGNISVEGKGVASLHEVRIGLEAIVLQLEMILTRIDDSNLHADLDALLQLARITRDAAEELADDGTPPQ